ncbi:MAG: ATP-dependent sacrificial sulfur transferase LarE [Lentisphaeria bacterium]|jgi:uncharacterized protein
MPQLPWRLLLLDVDGTLVDSRKRLLPEVRLAVRQAVASGLPVTLATGRMSSAVLPWARELGVRTPLICNNGADLVDPATGDCLRKLTLDPAAARQALAFGRDAGVSIALFSGPRVFVPERTPDHWLIERNYETVTVRPFPELIAAPPPSEKLLFLDQAHPERLPPLRDALLRHAGAAEFLAEITEPGILNICHPASGKLAALRELARRLGLAPGELAVIGDSDNDAGMIRYAGLGIAMANATPPTLAAARFVTAAGDEAGLVPAICDRLLRREFAPDAPGSLATTLRELRLRIRAAGSAVVAFSGGSDSSLVLRLAAEELPPEKLLAVTATSAVFPEADRQAAAALAAELAVTWQLLDMEATNRQRWYGANPENRCYLCKHAFYGKLAAIARERQLAAVLDGENADDLRSHRPGRRAAVEHGIRSPLAESGLAKADVRALGRELGLPQWDRPANACLATRFPHGTPLTPAALAQVARAEAVLAEAGFRSVRVRVVEGTARVEVAQPQVPLAQARIGELERRLMACGFARVEVDPRGYRPGAMAERAVPGQAAGAA